MSKEWQFYDYDFGVSDYSGEDLSRLLETVDFLSGCDDYPSCVGGRYLSGYYGSWMPAQARTQQMEDHGRETGFGYPRTETGWVCEPKRVGAEGEKLNPIVLAKTAPSRAS